LICQFEDIKIIQKIGLLILTGTKTPKKIHVVIKMVDYDPRTVCSWGINGLTQATLTTYNISIVAGSTEYSQALPENTRAIEFRSRLEVDVICSLEAGKVAGPTANYFTLDGGLQYYKEGLNLTDKTLYVAGTAGDVVELLAWS